MKQMQKQAGQGAEQPDVSVLTERQRMAYTLRRQGLTYAKVGEAMGISTNAATAHVKAAERRFREYQLYHDKQKSNDRPVELPLTYGELELVMEGLGLLQKDMLNRIGGRNVRSDWKGRLPYEAQILSDVYRKAQAALYGKAIISGITE